MLKALAPASRKTICQLVWNLFDVVYLCIFRGLCRLTSLPLNGLAPSTWTGGIMFCPGFETTDAAYHGCESVVMGGGEVYANGLVELHLGKGGLVEVQQTPCAHPSSS